ncbi:MAG TPA: hypothetical protein VN673_14145, partial [Clostridia bacterium]|nr:hypothetical protein [Clostridia bacterium]
VNTRKLSPKAKTGGFQVEPRLYFCCLVIAAAILISLGKTHHWMAVVGMVIAVLSPVLVLAIMFVDEWYHELLWRKRRSKKSEPGAPPNDGPAASAGSSEGEGRHR